MSLCTPRFSRGPTEVTLREEFGGKAPLRWWLLGDSWRVVEAAKANQSLSTGLCTPRPPRWSTGRAGYPAALAPKPAPTPAWAPSAARRRKSQGAAAGPRPRRRAPRTSIVKEPAARPARPGTRRAGPALGPGGLLRSTDHDLTAPGSRIIGRILHRHAYVGKSRILTVSADLWILSTLPHPTPLQVGGDSRQVAPGRDRGPGVVERRLSGAMKAPE